MNTQVKRASAVVLPLALLALDRLAKWYAFAALSNHGGVVLVSGVKYEYFFNAGLAFSLFSPAVATAASALALTALAIFALRHRLAGQPLGTRSLWAFCLIALGGISNVYDRILNRGVTDYIIFARSAWNIADIMILAGIALIVWGGPKGGKTDDLA
jgi:lipoprotein signal peptidase